MSKPNLQPPSRNSENIAQQSNGSETLAWIFAGIILCLILIIAAMLLMPSASQPEVRENKKTIAIKEQDKDKQDHEEKVITDSKAFNKKIEIDWLLKKTDAETLNMSIWSERDYKLALETADMAAQFKQEKQFDIAENHYIKAIEIIEKALKEKEIKFHEFIAQANIALEKGNLIQAKELFKKAQAMAIGNEEIEKGLFRVEHRKEVKNLYQLAIENENNNDLENAIENLKKALIIEPGYQKAKNKLAVLQEKKLAVDFQKTISFILKALENNDIKNAQQGLIIAENLKPSDEIIKELKNRIENKRISLAIKRLQDKAKIQEKNEQWLAALNSYRDILKYDPDASSAIINKQRVKLYIELNTMLDDIILKPERLQNDKILENSIKTLANIEVELKRSGNLLYPISKTPVIAKKITNAQRIIKQASVRVPVTIKSDNETEVAIYKVAKFGKLNEKKIFLRPGNYTIVGSRTNYRDYRKTIKIKASDQSLTLNVRCREKI